jgi:hypothetical protein
MYLRTYVKLLFAEHWKLMSCALFTLLGVVILAFNKDNGWALKATLALSALLILVASYLLWKDQFSRNEAADGVGIVHFAGLQVEIHVERGFQVAIDREPPLPKGGIRIGLILENLKDRLVEYHINAVELHIEGGRPNGVFVNQGGFIYPRRTSLYLVPIVPVNDTSKLEMTGQLDYSISYRVQGVSTLHHTRKSLRCDFYTSPVHYTYAVTSEYED